MRAARHERRQPDVLRPADQPGFLNGATKQRSTERAVRHRTALAALACLALLTSCAIGGSHKKGAGNSPANRDLAARPGQPAPIFATTTTGAATVSTALAGGRSASTVAGASPSTAVAPAVGTAAPPPLRASVADPAGDQGQLGPAYADVRDVRLEQAGDVVKVTVVLGGGPPAKLPSSEVMGVGVNFFHDQSETESDYQLFADGEPDGWFAYLQTPSGFVKYPGTFDLASDGLTFSVPASALGDLRHSFWNAFVDWSRSGTPSSSATTDHAPDAGRVAIAG